MIESTGTKVIIRLVAILIAAGVACAIAGGRAIVTPAMPSDWQKLHPGMSRGEVLATATGEHLDLRDLKGFDLLSQKTTVLGARSYWQLSVSYDESGKLVRADAAFICTCCGLLNQRDRSVF